MIRGGCATRKHKTRGQGLSVFFSRNPCLGCRGRTATGLQSGLLLVFSSCRDNVRILFWVPSRDGGIALGG